MSNTTISLIDVLRDYRKNAVLMVAVIAVFTFIGALYAYLTPQKYTSTITLMPAGSSGGNIGSKFGGLTSLIGLGGGMQGDVGLNFTEFQNLLLSRKVADQLAQDPRILTTLFEPEWDTETKTWKEPGSLVHHLKKILLRKTWSAPDGERLLSILDQKLIIREKEIGLIVTLSITHKSAEFAAYLLDKLTKEADAILRHRKAIRSSTLVGFLRQELEETTNVDHRKALAEMLVEEEKGLLLLQTGLPVGARVTSPSSVSSLASEPRVLFILIMSFILGVFGAIFGVGVKEQISRLKTDGS